MASAVPTDDPAGDEVPAGEGYTGVLAELSETTRSELERRVREVRLAAGVVIFHAGEVGDALYVVRSGLVDVTTGDDDDRHLRTFGPGDIFGEQALLTGRPRSARAVAQTGVTLWRLDHTDFLYLMGSDPQLGAAVARTLSERLTATNRLGTGSPRGQSVVLATSPAAVAADLVAEFAAATSTLLGQDPLVIACGPAEDWVGTSLPAGTTVSEPDGLAEAAVRAVRQNDLVILLCASTIPPTVYGGADRVIIVGDAPVHLVRTRGHAPRVVAAVSGKDDVGALAREVCGRRIGLALGSGGIRGWAHAGIVGVLAEEGIPVDFVSGASAGALAGALFVSGMSADAMLEIPTIARDVLSACLRTYRLPTQSILSGRPFIRYLRDRLGDDARIEDLPKPLVISTTDLDTREAVHLTSGPLAESIVASAAVNGIFPPITIDGRRLVDGGASDPVPVGALRDLGADIVIAVNVMDVGRGAAGVYTPRFRIPMPGMIDNLLIGLDTVISQAAAQSCSVADVVVTPRRSGATWRDLLPAAKYAAAGASAMRAELPRIRRLLGEDPGQLHPVEGALTMS
ncbi:MAG: cyclic nucleotide-binding and patatin-like phospholipase domain-containing protein [Acidimicrobiales bacterium]